MKKYLPFIFTFIGILAFCFLTVKAGIQPIISILSQVGTGGFLLLVAVQFVLNIFLGIAWKSSVPQISFIRLTASRFIRDAAASCLPFSQLGGMVIGIRAATAGYQKGSPVDTSCRHIPDWPEGIAANLVDITTELLGQIPFVVIALFCLIGYQNTDRFVYPLLAAIGLLSLGVAGFVWTQQRGAGLKKIAQFLARHIAVDWQEALIGHADIFQKELEKLWQNPARIAAGALLHLLCWLGSAFATWLGLHLLGCTSISLLNAIAIEGVVCGIMSAGFLVPGSLGVQEGAYVTLGLIFGLNSEISLALSFLRRGRDIVIGVPVLLLWQGFEFYFLKQQNKNALVSVASPVHPPEKD